jgi:hypothetical protein
VSDTFYPEIKLEHVTRRRSTLRSSRAISGFR